MDNDLEPVILEETKEHRIELDQYGRKVKLCKGKATISLPMDYPVRDMDSWLKIKHWFTFNENRIDHEAVKTAQTAQKNGAVVGAWIPGGFDLPRQLMGEEEVCYCYYDHPELMRNILETITKTSLKVLDRISDLITIDNLMVHEDMAGKSGSLIGPDLIREYIKPFYNIKAKSPCL